MVLGACMQVAPALAASAAALDKEMKKNAVHAGLRRAAQLPLAFLQAPATVEGADQDVPEAPPLPQDVGTSQGGSERPPQLPSQALSPEDTVHEPATTTTSTTQSDLADNSTRDLDMAISDVRQCLQEVRDFRGWLLTQA